MPKDLTWDDAEDLGIELSEAHPDVDPLTVRFTDLHAYVLALPKLQRRSQEVQRRQAGGHPNGMARRSLGPHSRLETRKRNLEKKDRPPLSHPTSLVVPSERE